MPAGAKTSSLEAPMRIGSASAGTALPSLSGQPGDEPEGDAGKMIADRLGEIDRRVPA